jgi:N-acetylmuramoyl-L-alanine amidase
MFGPIAAAAAALLCLAAPGSLLFTPGTAASPAAAPPIIDKPIAFPDERKKLTIEYRRIHQDPAIDDITIEPRMIVLHYTGGSSGKGTWRYFNRTHLESGREKLRGGGAVNVSAHFVIERDGTIYRLMPETWMARHCIGLNHVAIGVENVGNNDTHPLTAAQVAANAALVRYLVARHGITHLIGHHESRAMEGTGFFVERDARYRNRKPDPGKEFMRKVRERVADLGLQGPPE